jgi:nucleotide-binding universal stress UspA family protein
MAHILLPTDFSPNALNAAIYAVNLFGTEGNTFTLVNSFTLPRGVAGSFVDLRPHMAEVSREGLILFLHQLIEALPDHEPLFCTSSEHGELATVLERLHRSDLPPDVVVMGTQGATGLKRILLGSNTAAVIQRSEVPVIAVPEECTYKAPQRIVLADDGGLVERSTVSILLDIARWSKAEVKIVHVVPEGPASEDDLSASGYDLLLGAIPHSYHSISGDNVMVALHDLADQSDSDLVVVLHRKRGLLEQLFHRSVSARLAMHTHIPMMVLQQAGS